MREACARRVREREPRDGCLIFSQLVREYTVVSVSDRWHRVRVGDVHPSSSSDVLVRRAVCGCLAYIAFLTTYIECTISIRRKQQCPAAVVATTSIRVAASNTAARSIWRQAELAKPIVAPKIQPGLFLQ